MRLAGRVLRTLLRRALARSGAVLGRAALVLAAVTPAAADETLAAARARWAAANLRAYEYGYHKICACYPDKPPETLVRVRDGVVADVRHRHAGFDTDVRAEERNFDAYWTVDGLFDLVATALARASTVRVAYDDAVGYPTQIYIDYDRDFIGDELELELTRVTALPR
jgi:hypothetical protein